MKAKKIFAAACAASMAMSCMAVPAFAGELAVDATLGEHSTKAEEPATGATTVEKNHQSTKVYAAVNGFYTITVPESINLHKGKDADKDKGTGTYTNTEHCKVNLRGDIRENQTVTVAVTNPTMKCTGSQDVTATVDTTSKTVWTRDDMKKGDTIGATGTDTIYPVSAELTPGDWEGTATFNCTLK